MVIGLVGEENAKKMSQKQLDMLARQLADVRGIKLPDLPEVAPEELGASDVGAMQSDEGLRSRQLQSLGEIQNVIDSGGLDLTDKASIEQALGAAIDQQRRARAGVADDAAQRGQLNSGSRLVMDMDAASRGSNDARKNALDVAGMAQRRRLQAIQDAASMAGGLREQDWREKESAARARDLRAERNANAREKAKYYNAGIPQQEFTNALGKATGQMPAANAMAQGLGNAATDARASAAGIAGTVGAYDRVTQNAAAQQTPGFTYSTDSNNYAQRGSSSDLSKDDDK